MASRLISMLWCALLLVTLQAFAIATPTFYPNSQKVLAQEDVNIRPAVAEDLDDFITIYMDAFSPGPLWRYAFPHLERYREFVWDCMRQTASEEFARPNNTTFVMVVPRPEGSVGETRQGHTLRRIVALGVWKILSPTSDAAHQSHLHFGDPLAMYAKCAEHPEANLTRLVDVQRQMVAIEKRYVYDFPGEQLYLAGLATHPDWDGHGFGAANLHWGMNKARSMGGRVPLTLLGTPAGWPLYDSVGFKSVANVTVSTLDEDLDDLWLEYMRYEQASTGV